MSEGITVKSDKVKLEELKDRIQKSIQGTNSNNVFNSVLDWSGKYICYPDKKSIGSAPPESDGLTPGVQNELTGENLYDMVLL